jgi:WD40-like Beta Propeller Repeat
MQGGEKPFPLTDTRFNEQGGRFSPDSRWITYSSDESGKPEIYVRPFPGPGSRPPISSGGGVAPQWSGDGKKIYYVTSGWRLMETAVKSSGRSIQAGMPRILFSIPREVVHCPPGPFPEEPLVFHVDSPVVVLMCFVVIALGIFGATMRYFRIVGKPEVIPADCARPHPAVEDKIEVCPRWFPELLPVNRFSFQSRRSTSPDREGSREEDVYGRVL